MQKEFALKIQKQLTHIANEIFTNDNYRQADAYNDLDSLVDRLSKYTHARNQIKPVSFPIMRAQPMYIGEILTTTDDHGRPRKIQITKVTKNQTWAQYVKN